MDTSLIRERTQKSGEGFSQCLVTSEDPKGGPDGHVWDLDDGAQICTNFPL